MIKTIYINNLSDIYELISEQKYDTNKDRHRSSFLYRGLSNETYTLKTSLMRNCKNKQQYLEKCILRNFTKYAEFNEPHIKESVWRQMILGQHHGLPTRLLDWSYSPLVAMHFACSADNLSELDKNNSCVWKIDIEEINSLLPKKYKDALAKNDAYLFTMDMLETITTDLNAYDNDMLDQSMVLIEPPSIDQRIINQYSYFSVIPMEMENIEAFFEQYTNNTCRYIIPNNIKWRIRDLLDQMNINERIMYPGLDGLSTWLKRHYFVKDTPLDNK